MLRVLDAPADVLLIRIGDEDPLEGLAASPCSQWLPDCVQCRAEVVLMVELRGLFDVRDWRRVQLGSLLFSAWLQHSTPRAIPVQRLLDLLLDLQCQPAS